MSNDPDSEGKENQDILKCDQCSCRFTLKSNLRRHQREKHGSEKVELDLLSLKNGYVTTARRFLHLNVAELVTFSKCAMVMWMLENLSPSLNRMYPVHVFHAECVMLHLRQLLC